MNQELTKNEPKRDAHGRLTKGGARPGAGRPAGSSERDKIRALAQPHRKTAIDVLVEVMSDKDAKPDARAKAADIVLSRLAAPPKAQDERVVIPGLKTATTLEAKCAAVLEAVATGQVSATAGRQVLAALSDVAKILEISDLEERIRRLEGKAPRVINADEEPLA